VVVEAIDAFVALFAMFRFLADAAVADHAVVVQFRIVENFAAALGGVLPDYVLILRIDHGNYVAGYQCKNSSKPEQRPHNNFGLVAPVKSN